MRNFKIIITVLTLLLLSCSGTVTGPEFGPERKIVYEIDGNLFVTNPEGTGLKQLTFTSNHFRPAWSPNGTKIAFGSNQFEGGWDIFVIDIDGSNMIRLTSESVSTYSTDLLWSPDGTKIAATFGDDIYVMDSDGSNLTKLASGRGVEFSPDGSRVVFYSSSIDQNLNLWVSDIFIMDLDGSNKTRIATGYVNRDMDFSPDGTKIVFTKFNGPEAEAIYIMNVDGSDVIRLTFGDKINTSPSFSPDGTKIVFVSYRDGEGSNIYTMNTDGTDQTPLTNTGSYLSGNSIGSTFPEWSPDGEYIVFSETEHDIFLLGTTLKIMRSDGSQPVSLATDPGFISFSFSPIW